MIQRLAATAVILLTSLTLMQQQASAEVVLKFGTYAADKPTQTIKKYRALLNTLEYAMTVRLGEPVRIKMKLSNNYDKAINRLANGEVDFARFGPASYVHAKSRNPDIKIVAMESAKGHKTFKGLIVAHVDSDIQSLSDIRNRTFAFGSKLSTIGRYLSQLELLKVNIRSTDLGRHEYLGRHDRVGRAVGAGLFDVGALKESTFKKLVKSGVKIRKVASFDNVTKPWIARSNMPERIRVALKRSLLDITDKKALKGLKKSGFLPGTDADYAVIREAMQRNAEFGSGS